MTTVDRGGHDGVYGAAVDVAVAASPATLATLCLIFGIDFMGVAPFATPASCFCLLPRASCLHPLPPAPSLTPFLSHADCHCERQPGRSVVAITTTITCHAEPKAEPQWWSAAAAAATAAEAAALTHAEVATKAATVMYVLYGADDDVWRCQAAERSTLCENIAALLQTKFPNFVDAIVRLLHNLIIANT